MQEYIAMEAARKELLSSFNVDTNDYPSYAWDRFELWDKPWCMWKDGVKVKLFYLSTTGTVSYNAHANRSDILLIADNADYVLFRSCWRDYGAIHYSHIIVEKRRMVNTFEGIERYLRDGKKPTQVTFTKGVENSCSLNRS